MDDGSTLSDADKIRAKRLAKLQAAQPVHTPSQIHSLHDQLKDVETAPLAGPPKPQATSPAPIPLPSLKRAGPSSPQGSSTKVRPPTAPSITLIKVTGPSTTNEAAVEDWEDKVLSHIFQATVDPSRASKSIVYLESQRKDLEEQGEEVKMCLSILDQVIIEVASNSLSSPFTYILECYKRTSESFSKVQRRAAKSAEEYQLGVLREIKRLCVSYYALCITTPELFGLASVSLSKELIRDSDDKAFIPQDLLQELGLKVEEEDKSLAAEFLGAMESISSSVAEMSLLDDYLPYLNAFGRLATIKPMAHLMSTSERFVIADCPAPEIETVTLLGPLFRLSPLQAKVVKAYFPNPRTLARATFNSTAQTIRTMQKTHQEQLTLIVNALVRASVDARNRMLDFFAYTVNANDKRRALQVEENKVSSDGFLLNINAILTKLCEPFMDVTYSKIDKVDVRYFRQKPRVNIKDETKLNSDQETSDEFYAQKDPGMPNFISDVFFLNTAAYHVGFIASGTNLSNLGKDLKDMERHLERLKQERPKYLNSSQLPLLDRNLKTLEDRIQTGISYEAALSSVLADQETEMQALSFMNFVTMWILRLISPEQSFPVKPLSLQLLSEIAPETFSNLPEYLVEDIAILFRDIIRNEPSRISAKQAEGMTIFAITFLRMSSYIKNPYLRAKFAEVLYFGIHPTRNHPAGIFGDILNGDKFALNYLMHSLMSCYIEVEQTGAHNQFYEKFNIRYYVAQVVKAIWKNPTYRERLGQESSGNAQFFIRFVALLMNDATYLLDESLSKLLEIHKLQRELKDETLTSQSYPTREEKEQQLASAERTAQSYVGLANETVLMAKLFTAAIPDAFVAQEIVHRLAAMLDYNLNALVGPKCGDLKVEKPQKYKFDPKQLLGDVASIYLNLGTRPAFVEAIAKDGRSYKPEDFVRAHGLLQKYDLLSQEDLNRFTELAQLVQLAKLADDEGEEELGDDIPEEFLDPLMATLMEEPVILPSSKAVVDMSTIKSYLLSDSRDPFNRHPLKIEDVVPDVELKQKIQDFKREKKEARKAAQASALALVQATEVTGTEQVMDLTQ